MNVKRLSVFFLGYDELEKDIAWNDVNELVTFIKDKGFIPITEHDIFKHSRISQKNVCWTSA